MGDMVSKAVFALALTGGMLTVGGCLDDVHADGDICCDIYAGMSFLPDNDAIDHGLTEDTSDAP